jgi:hypothetical protein
VPDTALPQEVHTVAEEHALQLNGHTLQIKLPLGAYYPSIHPVALHSPVLAIKYYPDLHVRQSLAAELVLHV